MLSNGAKCNTEKIFRVSYNLRLISKISETRKIIVKYEKREKYMPILHETTSDNYFIVKCLLKPNVTRVILPSY